MWPPIYPCTYMYSDARPCNYYNFIFIYMFPTQAQRSSSPACCVETSIAPPVPLWYIWWRKQGWTALTFLPRTSQDTTPTVTNIVSAEYQSPSFQPASVSARSACTSVPAPSEQQRRKKRPGSFYVGHSPPSLSLWLSRGEVVMVLR